MKLCIEPVMHWLNRHPRLKQWAWFIALWLGGMGTFWMVAYPLKLIIKNVG